MFCVFDLGGSTLDARSEILNKVETYRLFCLVLKWIPTHRTERFSNFQEKKNFWSSFPAKLSCPPQLLALDGILELI